MLALLACCHAFSHHIALIEATAGEVVVRESEVSESGTSAQSSWRVPLSHPGAELRAAVGSPGKRYGALLFSFTNPRNKYKAPIVAVLDLAKHVWVGEIEAGGYGGWPVWDSDGSLLVRVGYVDKPEIVRCTAPLFAPIAAPTAKFPPDSNLDSKRLDECIEILASAGVGTPPSYRYLSASFYANMIGGIIGDVRALPDLSTIALFGQASRIDSWSRTVGDLLLLRKADHYRPIVVSGAHQNCWFLQLTSGLLFFGASDLGHRALLVFSLADLSEVARLPTSGFAIVTE